MSELTHAIEMLSPEKRALLFQRLRERRGVSASTSAIPRQSRATIHFPLSFAQQRLWFLDQWQPGNAAYNIALVLRLTGNLHTSALQLSLAEIVKRHESLRTSFTVSERQPVQVISQSLDLPLPVIDLTAIPEREQAVQQLALTEGQKPFDLTHAPLMRTSLLRLDSNEHILLLTMHHIIADGWSLSILLRELAILYPSFVAKQPSPLSAPSLQYVDFAVWQQEQLQGEILESHLSYWKRQLADAPALLELPQQHARPAVQSSRGARSTFLLAPPLVTALQSLGQSEDASLFMVLLAVFQVLLHRYTGQDDIVVGTPIANRTRAEIENIIGFFVNTLALRADFSEKPTFRELLKRVRATTLEAYTHQDLPFERLVEALQPERDLSYSPIFQILFGLQNAPTRAWHLPALTISEIPLHNATAKFDLMLLLEETEAGLKGELTYNTDLYDEATISHMIGHYQALLEGVMANPDQHISALPLLPKAERQQILLAWNSTEKDYQADACLHQLFESQVAQQPDSIAIDYDAGQLTYSTLNGRANELAQQLRALQVGPEVVVGLCFERSPDLAIGILAILQAGGAYLPLDPHYPRERLAFLLQDAQVPLLLTQQHLKDTLSRATKAQIICLHDPAPLENNAGASENPLSGVTGENLAYVIYTSGSTGKPKGVGCTHASVYNLVSWHWQAYQVATDDRASQVASIDFDASVWELWPYLLIGSSVSLLEEDLRSDPRMLYTWLQEQAITISFLPTPLAEHLISFSWPVNGSLRLLLTGGDRLSRFPSIPLPFALVNHYGPTESTVVTTAQWLGWRKASPYQAEGAPPIGRPIANTQVYLCDQHLCLVPIGVPGELYIGGVGLARGYLHRPDLTAERFLPNPWGAEPGERLYKTGDLARYLSDGTIEYLGRLDHQVKLRGFRIEPGEIEVALSEHPALQATVIKVCEDHRGEKYLAAYVVPTPGRSAPTIHDLRAFLQQHLPAYMVPTSFVTLTTLPLTTNGKVDRQALPLPDELTEADTTHAIAPRDPLEEMLAEIWCDLLVAPRFIVGEQISIYDDFFAVGGHSLLATQVISRIRQVLQIDLSQRTLFEFPSIASMAEHIRTTRHNSAQRRIPPIEAVSRSEPLPLSFAQQRLWFLNQLEPDSPNYTIPLSLRLTGPLQLQELQQSLTALIHRHEILHTTIGVIEEQPVQVIRPIETMAFPIIDLTGLPDMREREQIARQLAREEVRKTFNLVRGPLLRAALLRLDAQEHILLLTMHHIICDGWSVGVLVRDLSAYYTASVTGQPANLSVLPIQYRARRDRSRTRAAPGCRERGRTFTRGCSRAAATRSLYCAR